ncbi:autotransporter outer membrane beta-barrel domain-containing protein [Thalassovita aquimarina]|uniref:Autotransporter outer membrane beta-barrel domain-containing protein n=1 Tax=Thalassovita aquimarina TaxID=2785917 RepID=A0ABS5HR82_9RHOB|nr:autotransporter outer membrane beta-barrel domain-containing protein [Thalassovita aquimarina]MBR9651489.1 autotransporter outer membrane beta-barrel domain-containing protein [Thalassovita aquimarina]
MNRFSALAARLAHTLVLIGSIVVAFVLQAAAAQAQPTWTLTFSPSTIGVNGTSVATFTITNGSGTPVTSLAFTDNLTAGLAIASTPNASTTCPVDQGGGPYASLSAPAGGSTIAFSDGALPGGSSCTVTLNITGTAAGSFTDTTGALTSSAGNSGTASATLTVDSTRLSFSKTIVPDTVSLNGTSTMTYTIENPTSTVVSSIAFNETLPSGVQIASPANAVTDCTAGTLTATAGGSSISLGGAFFTAAGSCTVTVDIQGAAAGSYTLTSSGLTSSQGTSGVASAEFTVNAPPASSVSLTKVFSGDPVAPGGTVTLGFTLYNTNAADAATNISFTDDLDAMLSGTTMVSAPSEPCGAGSSISGSGLISLSNGSLAARAWCSFDVTVQIPSGATTGTYTNTTSTVSATIDGSTVNSASGASDTLEVDASGEALQLGMSWASADAGTDTTVTFTVTNPNGSFAATNIAFSLSNTAPFPALPNYTLPPSTDTCGGAMGTTVFGGVLLQTYNYTGGTLAAGSTCTIAFNIEVPAGTASGIYPQTTGAIIATINGSSKTGDVATANLSVSPSDPNMSLTKVFDQSSAAAGSAVGLRFTLTNGSESISATDISFSDDLDTFHSGATLNSVVSDGCGGTPSGVGTGTFSYSGGSLAAISTCDIDVTVTLGAAVGTPVNTTSNLSASLDGGGVSELANTAASDTITVLSTTPLTASLEIIDDPVVAGGTATARYTINNPNSAPYDATGLFFTHPLSASLSTLQASAPLPTDPCGAGSTLSGTTTLTLSGGSIVAGGSCSFDVTLAVPGGAADGDYSLLTSSISYTIDGGGTSIDPVSDTLSIGLSGEGSSTFALSKTFDSSYVMAGASAGLTLTLENLGTEDATGITFTDDLSGFLSGTSFGTMTANDCGGALTGEGGTLLTVSGVALTAGTSCTIRIPVDFDAGASLGVATNTTSDVSGTTASGAVGGPAASDSIEVRSATVPTFTKSIVPSTTNTNSSVVISYSISNPVGGIAHTGLAFTDDVATDIPGAAATVLPGSDPCGAGSTVTGSGIIAMTAGTLAPGESCNFDVTISVPTPPSTTYTSTTSALTDAGIVLVGGASDTLTINPWPPSFSKVFAPDSMAQGDVTTLTFTVDASLSTGAVPGLSFTDNLPAGVVLAPSVNAATTCTGGTLTAAPGGSTVSYSGGLVNAASTCTISVDVTSVAVGAHLNTSGTLTSDYGDGGTASDTLTVTAAPAPSFAKAFAPASIVQGDVTTLTFTIDNSASLIAATSVEFTDNFPAGVTFESGFNMGFDASQCGDALWEAAPTYVHFTSTSIAAGAICTLYVDVTSSTIGSALNTSGDLTSSLGNSGTASATLTVTAAPAPNFAKAFAPASIAQGAVSTLTFTIDNSAALVEASSIDFTDNFPAGMTVAATPNASTTCTGGSVTAAAGAGSMSYSGGTVGAGSSCTVSVDVTSATLGPAANTSGDLTSSLGNSGTATDTLTVTAAPAPRFSKNFSPDRIFQGGETVLTFTIDNSSAFVAAGDLAFVDVFPAGMTVASTPGLSTTCTGTTIAAPAGSDRIEMTAGTVAANNSCSVQVAVTTATAGSVNNVSGDLTSTLGNSGTASATLSVRQPGAPDFTKAFAPASIAQGDVSTLTFTIDNGLAPIDASALDFTDSFPAGLSVAPTPNASTTCTGGTLTAAAGATSVSYTGGTVSALGSCTVSVDVTSVTVGDAANSTGDLTSSLGNSGSAAATLSVTAAGAPGFAKAFAPDSIVQGDVSTLTFTIDNSTALVSADNLDFSDNFPAGMTVAATPNDATTCSGGTVTATAGASSVSYSGGSVAALGSCTVSVDVTSATAGAAANTSGDLTSTLGNSGSAAATLTVTAAGAPGFTKGFAPASIAQGDVTTLTFTIDNSATLVSADNIDFSDSFPAGMTVASTPNAASTCSGGTLTATAGADTVTYTGGTVAAGASCEITVDVTSATVGDATNTSGTMTSSLGDSGTASATLSVTAADAPIMTQRFDPDTIAQGGTSTLIVTIDNTANFINASSLAFGGTFPSNLTIADPTGASSSCGGALVATAGANGFSFSGGTVAAQDTCEVRLDVTATSVGALASSLSALSSSQGASAAPADTEVTVIVNTNAYVTFVQQSSEDGTFGFSSTESALNFSIVTSGGSGAIGPIEVPSGSYTVAQSRPSGIGNESISCSDDDSGADVTGGLINLELDNFESVTCTISSVASLQQTVDTIHNFLHRRNNLLLSNQPSQSRRLARLNSGGTGGQRLNFATGDIMSMSPLEFDLMSIGSGNYRVSTSSQRMRTSRVMALLAHNPDLDNMYVQNTSWDVWFEGVFNRFEGGQGAGGHFALGYFGADYVLSKDLLIGALIQFDSMRDASDLTGSTVEGRGWMAGPYVTARLAPNLIFDGRFALGRSTNDISPFNTYTDTFETERFLVDASLSGQYELQNNWTMSPNFAVSYIRENQQAYVDTLGVSIPGQRVALGQLRFGPNFSRRVVMPGGDVWEPHFTVDAIYNFSDGSGAILSSNATTETDGLRARIEGGFNFIDRNGLELRMSANYDGIGQSDFESYGASLQMTIPLQ